MIKFQGPKSTFLGRRQLATKMFFHLPGGKTLSPKVSIKFFFQQNTNTNQKFWWPVQKLMFSRIGDQESAILDPVN